VNCDFPLQVGTGDRPLRGIVFERIVDSYNLVTWYNAVCVERAGDRTLGSVGEGGGIKIDHQ